MYSFTRTLPRSSLWPLMARSAPPHLLSTLRLGSTTIFLSPSSSLRSSRHTSTSTATSTSLAQHHAHHLHHQPAPALYNLTPTDLTALLFDSIHALPLSLSWPATIALTALLLRTSLTLPLAWYAHRTALRMHAVRPLARAWSHSLAHSLRAQSHAQGWTFQQFQAQYKKQYAEALGKLYLDNGIRPLFSLLAPLAQVPVWVAASMGLRRLCDPSLDKTADLARVGLENVPVELANSAFLWAPSLVVPDPTWIGPMVLSGLHLANVHLAMRARTNSPNSPPSPAAPATNDDATEVTGPKTWDRQQMMVWGMRGLAVAMIPVAKTVPFALVVYWSTSAGFSLVQNVVFKVLLAPPLDDSPTPPKDAVKST